jgi:hypothetical protein
MFWLAAMSTATVLVFKLAACSPADVVTPVAMMRVQAVFAFSTAVAAVNTIEAVAWPELLSAPVKVVVPQPLLVTVRAPLVPVKVGSTSDTLSPCAKGHVSRKRYSIELSVAFDPAEMKKYDVLRDGTMIFVALATFSAARLYVEVTAAVP